MQYRSIRIFALVGVILGISFGVKIDPAVALPQRLDRGAIEQIFGRRGAESDSVLKFTFPRSDLHVKVDTTPVEPALALTSWVAFQPVQDGTMVMGDLVLQQQEVPAVMKGLRERGVRITALHNHLLEESPRIMYLHIEGEGDPVLLATKIRDVLRATTTPIASPAPPKEPPSFDWTQVESIMGRPGVKSGRMLQFSIPRLETITAHGMAIPASMGVAHAINFQAVGAQAATAGDLVLLASEVNPVIDALQRSGMAVTAVHNHMLDESPRLFFLHFWGKGEPAGLAHGLRKALDQT